MKALACKDIRPELLLGVLTIDGIVISENSEPGFIYSPPFLTADDINREVFPLWQSLFKRFCRLSRDETQKCGWKNRETAVSGAYDGEGVLYESGVIVYEGQIESGVNHGDGRVYDNNGTLIYEGNLNRGVYHGTGKLYNPETGYLRYSGEFANGVYDGNGRLYDDMQHILYVS